MAVEKATKAMYEVIRRGKRHNLSIECLLDLFDKIVKPLLTQGTDIFPLQKKTMQKFIRYGRQLGSFSSK
jgi:ribosomal protein S3AE